MTPEYAEAEEIPAQEIPEYDQMFQANREAAQSTVVRLLLPQSCVSFGTAANLSVM